VSCDPGSMNLQPPHAMPAYHMLPSGILDGCMGWICLLSSCPVVLVLQLGRIHFHSQTPLFQAKCSVLFISRLSPTADSFENSNLKWVSNTIPIAFNKVPIQKTHFGYQKRHNPNLVSSLLKTQLQRVLSFRSCYWRRLKIGMEPFTCSATQRTNGSCILGDDCWR